MRASKGVLTGRDIGVEHSAILQGSCVPTAHSVTLLWEVSLVSFLQNSLEKFGRTLRNQVIQDYDQIS